MPRPKIKLRSKGTSESAVPRQNDDQPLNQQLANRAVTLIKSEAEYSQSFGEAQRTTREKECGRVGGGAQRSRPAAPSMPSALGSRRSISVNIAAGGVYACYPHCFNERHLARESRGPSGCATSAAPGRKRFGSLCQLQTLSLADVWPLFPGLALDVR